MNLFRRIRPTARYLADKKVTFKKTHQVFSYFFILMMTSGVWNAFFSGSILAGWKQLILIVGYLMCFLLVKNTPDLRRIFVTTLFIQITLVLTSIIAGIAPEVVFYNLFYYSAWVPFYIWAARGGTDFYLGKYSKFTFCLVIVCGVGLVVDSKTDIFMFLATRQEELDMNYFLQHSEVVKRSAFIFTTSTLVMPVLGGMIVVGLLRNLTALRAAISAVVILIGIVTSASTNSAVLSAGLLLGILMQSRMRPLRIVNAVLVFSVTIFIVAPMVGGEEFFSKQIGHIAERQTLDAEGNIGRIWHWEKALDDIQEFSILQHIVGSGLGTTNENNGNQIVLHTHGESSFFQAYLEGGILGLALRLMPFFLIATLVKFYSLNNRPYLILGYIFTVFFIDAIAPLFGNIPSQALLGFLMGELYLCRKKLLKPSLWKTA